MEEWRILSDYPNYQASSHGNIRHINSNKNRKLHKTKNGYLQVCFNIGGSNNKSILVHQLIGKAFLPNINNLPVIDHIDRNKENNTVENLRWSSRALNTHNTTKKENCSSRYKGVYREKNGKYVCRSSFNGVKVYLGRFDTEEEAARVYNEKAVEVYGTDALLNEL